MADIYKSPPQVALEYGVSTSTLAKWRLRGFGPRFARLGRRVAYPNPNSTPGSSPRCARARASVRGNCLSQLTFEMENPQCRKKPRLK